MYFWVDLGSMWGVERSQGANGGVQADALLTGDPSRSLGWPGSGAAGTNPRPIVLEQVWPAAAFARYAADVPSIDLVPV